MSVSKTAKILLYTDGVVDAASAGGKRFTLDGLCNCLGNSASLSAQSMLDKVTDAVDLFRRGNDLSDDLTLVAIELQPSATAAALAGASI